MKRIWAVLIAVICLFVGLAGIAETDIGEMPYNRVIQLKHGEKHKESGNYAITYEEVRLVSDEKLHEGYWWYYVSSEKDGAEEMRMDYPVGTHMPVFVRFTFINMSKDEVDLLNRVWGTLVYDNKYSFDVVPMQVNPNQVTNKGNKGRVSTVGVPVEPLISVDLWLCGAVPIPVRDSKSPLVLNLTINGMDEYRVDLRDKDAITMD